MEALSSTTLENLLDFLALYNPKEADPESESQTLEMFELIYNDFIFDKKVLTIRGLTNMLFCGRKLNYDLSKLMLLLEKELPLFQKSSFLNHIETLHLMNRISMLKYPLSISEKFGLGHKISKIINDKKFMENWIEVLKNNISFKDMSILLSILVRLNINDERFLTPMLSFFVKNFKDCEDTYFSHIFSRFAMLNKLNQPELYAVSMKKIDSILENPFSSISSLIFCLNSLLTKNNDLSRNISPESEIVKKIELYLEKHFSKISAPTASYLIAAYVNLNYNSKLLSRSFEIVEQNLETLSYEECTRVLKGVNLFRYTENKVFLKNLIKKIISTFDYQSLYELGFFDLYAFALENEEILKEIDDWEEISKKMMENYQKKFMVYGALEFKKFPEKKEIYWMLKAMEIEVYTRSVPELLLYFDCLIPDTDIATKLQQAQENIDLVTQKFETLRTKEVPNNKTQNTKIIPEKCIMIEYLSPNMIGRGESGATYLRGLQILVQRVIKRLGIKLVTITETNFVEMEKKEKQKEGIIKLIEEIKKRL